MTGLRVSNLTKHFGGIAALTAVNLEVAPGARHGIIGPNGAGKSTLFNVIAGEFPPTRGQVFLGEQEVTELPVYERANLGLGRTFQRNDLFRGLSTFANIRLAVQHRQQINHHWLTPIATFAETQKRSETILRQVGLLPYRDTPVANLAYGQQRALEIALAMASEPTVMLLDEPTAGMSPAETADMVQLIDGLPRSLTLLIVEHDMDVIFHLAEQVTVLHYGQVISQGTMEEVQADAEVQQIYLGGP